jgi:hypothetical protein
MKINAGAGGTGPAMRYCRGLVTIMRYVDAGMMTHIVAKGQRTTGVQMNVFEKM